LDGVSLEVSARGSRRGRGEAAGRPRRGRGAAAEQLRSSCGEGAEKLRRSCGGAATPRGLWPRPGIGKFRFE
jgi:hypothetical protein